MKEIILLTDYKNQFGSKQKASPYMGGMDKKLLNHYLIKRGYKCEFLSFSEIDFLYNNFANRIILYTSSEDKGYHYKSYIEDIIYGLKLQGARLIPDYCFLRANNNKVFMEIYRDLINFSPINGIKSYYLGTIEELNQKMDKISEKSVIKTAKGAMGSGVYLSKSKKDILRISKKISRTKYLLAELWDLKNKIKHKGFIKDSRYRKKFIVQDFVPGLKNDWKILIFGNRYFVVFRETRRNDFRASGSGKIKFKEQVPEGLLSFAKKIYLELNVPNLSVDIAFDGKEYFLFEFQAIYFGTKAFEYSDFYFYRTNKGWEIAKEKLVLEEVYINSIVDFIQSQNW